MIKSIRKYRDRHFGKVVIITFSQTSFVYTVFYKRELCDFLFQCANTPSFLKQYENFLNNGQFMHNTGELSTVQCVILNDLHANKSLKMAEITYGF